MTSDLSDRIAALIAAQRAGSGCSDWEQELAARFGAFAVYGDLGGAMLLRQDGSVFGLGWQDEQPSDVTPGWRLIALAAASYRFPELAALRPERPAAARPCSDCHGVGCEWCFGVGWRPDRVT